MRMTMIALCFALVLSVSASAQSRSIEGVWSLTEISSAAPSSTPKLMAQPSMYLFTKKHYSIIYVSSVTPRPEMDDLSTATADDLRKVFVESFVANAGTYEMKAGKITVRPMVAKSPGYMKAGTMSTLSVKIDGNTMTLTTEGTSSGPAAVPTTYKLKRVE